MCGMEWPLGGKAEWEVKCDSTFQKYFVWHLWQICGKLSIIKAHTSACKATFLFVIMFISSYNHTTTCGASRNCLVP